jgi:hypothetical protein
VEAQHAGHLDELGDAAGDQAAVAVAAQVLGGEEAEDGEVAEAAGATPLVARPERLAGVFDDDQAVITSSPSPMPAALRAIVRPSVPLPTPTEAKVDRYSVASASKAFTLGPRMNCPLRTTARTAASTSSCTSAICPLMSIRPIGTSHASR